MKIMVGIAHAGYLQGRTVSLDRLLDQLRDSGCLFPFIGTSKQPEHARVWARRLWRWVAQQPTGTPCVCLNDDVEVPAEFMKIVEAMVTAVSGEALSLHTQHPDAVKIAMDGHNWVRCYWLTGPGYVLYPEQAQELLAFADEDRNQILWGGNEDNVAIHWAWSKQQPFLSALPAVVKHDVTVKSTLGYDEHPNRVAKLLWDSKHKSWDPKDLWDVKHWTVVGEVPFVENPWAPTASLDAFRRGISLCSFCLINPCVAGSAKTGARICKACLAACVQHALVSEQ